jgi:hypothetical protein
VDGIDLGLKTDRLRTVVNTVIASCYINSKGFLGYSSRLNLSS